MSCNLIFWCTVNAVTFSLQRFPTDVRDSGNCTPLHLAAKHAHWWAGIWHCITQLWVLKKMFLVDWSKAYHLGYLYLVDHFHLVKTIVNVRKHYRLYFALYFIKSFNRMASGVFHQNTAC